MTAPSTVHVGCLAMVRLAGDHPRLVRVWPVIVRAIDGANLVVEILGSSYRCAATIADVLHDPYNEPPVTSADALRLHARALHLTAHDRSVPSAARDAWHAAANAVEAVVSGYPIALTHRVQEPEERAAREAVNKP